MAEIRTNLTEEEKNVILYLRRQGRSNQEIQNITGRSRTLIQLITSGKYEEDLAKKRQRQAELYAMQKQTDRSQSQTETQEHQITFNYRLLVEAFTEAIERVFGK